MHFLLSLLSPPAGRSLRSRVLLVLASVAVAVAIRHTLDPWLEDHAAYLLILPAVTLCAWVGGFWAGFSVTLLGTALSVWMFAGPRGIMTIDPGREFIFAAFSILQGTVVSALCGLVHYMLLHWQAAQRQAATDFENMADHAPGFVWASALDGKGSFVNRSWLLFTGVDSERSASNRLERLHPDDLKEVVKVMEDAKAARRSYYVEYRLKRADGAYRWILEHAVPRLGADGSFEGFIGSGTDITPAHQEREDLRFIGELQAALVATLDLDKTTEAITRAVAPSLADWCAVHLCDSETGNLTAANIHHENAGKQKRMVDLASGSGTADFVRTEGHTRILRERKPQLASMVDDAFLRGMAKSEKHLEELRSLGLISYLGVPLRVGERIIGVLSMATAESGRTLGHDTLQLALKVGGIVALAIDNAALHRNVREALAAESKARQERENSERRFRFAWDADIFGMCVIAPSGELQSANDTFLRLHGYTREDMDAGRVELFSRMEDREVRFGTFMWEHLQVASNYEPFEQICRNSMGRFMPVLVAGSILPEGEGCLVIMLDLSARKAAEAELERQRGLLKTIIDAVPAMVAYIDQEERFVLHNRQYERWMGIGYDDIHGKTVRELLGAERYPEAEPHLHAALAGNYVRYEKLIHGAGNSRDAMVIYRPDVDPTGRVRGVVIHAYDITETRAMAVAVQRSERRYRTLITATAAIVWTADADGRVREATGLEAFIGLETGGDFHETWVNAIHPEDRPRVIRDWEAVCRTRGEWEDFYRLLSADGSYHYVQVRGAVIFAPDGTLEEWIGTVTDIHKRVTAEELLRHKETELKLVVDAMPALVARVDRDQRYVMVNNGYKKWFGIEPDLIRGKRVEDVVGADTYPRVKGYIERVLTGEEVSYEDEMAYAFGPPRWVSIRLTPHANEDGEVVGYFALVLDISERKESELKVVELLERYRFLAEAMPQNVWTANAAGEQDYANRRWINYTGLSAANLASWPEIIHPEDIEPTRRHWEEVLSTGQAYQIEHRLRDRFGNYHWFLSLALARRDEGGSIVQWVGSSTNIDRQRLAYAELSATRAELREHADNLENEVRLRTARLEEVNGELEAFTYSASHDLRVPLQHIHSFAEVVMEDEQSQLSPASRDNLRLVLNAAKRMDALIHDLLAYSRMSGAEIQLVTIPLEEALAEVLAHYRATIQATKATIRVERPLPAVQADEVGLQQVLTNLIGNALKFTAPGNSPEIVIRAEPHGERVRVWIEDNGIGINPSQHETIFTIFNRLHSAREYAGTGVGLSLVRKGMARMGGACGVESERGQGSRFWLDFQPASERVD